MRFTVICFVWILEKVSVELERFETTLTAKCCQSSFMYIRIGKTSDREREDVQPEKSKLELESFQFPSKILNVCDAERRKHQMCIHSTVSSITHRLFP